MPLALLVLENFRQVNRGRLFLAPLTEHGYPFPLPLGSFIILLALAGQVNERNCGLRIADCELVIERLAATVRER
jgi:hypothetical protein